VVYKSNLEKKDLEQRLQNKNQELEESRKRYSEENEDKARRIGHLHAELKELQERLNEQNIKNSLLESKNQDLLNNFDRVAQENSENISRLKIENERLSGENNTLFARISKLSTDLSSASVSFDKQQHEHHYTSSKQEQDLDLYNSKLRDGNLRNNNLDGELKKVCQEK